MALPAAAGSGRHRLKLRGWLLELDRVLMGLGVSDLAAGYQSSMRLAGRMRRLLAQGGQVVMRLAVEERVAVGKDPEVRMDHYSASWPAPVLGALAAGSVTELLGGIVAEARFVSGDMNAMGWARGHSQLLVAQCRSSRLRVHRTEREM